MERKQLMQLRYLNSEIKMWRDKLAELEKESVVKATPTDAVGGRSVGKFNSNVENLAVRTADIKSVIEGKLTEIKLLQFDIMQYINTLDDSLLRQIVFYRCVSCLSWEAVAVRIGGGNTADAVRKRFDRAFPNKYKS